jgi:hypothetical protein
VFTDPHYWAGVATPFMVFVALYVFAYLVLRPVFWVWDRSGLFIEFGELPEPFDKNYGRLTVDRKFKIFYVGRHRTHDWGSNWYGFRWAVIGRRSNDLTLG